MPFPDVIDWLQHLDVSLFRFINLTLRATWLDAVMPFFNWNALFIPVMAALVLFIVVKGGARGRIFVVILALSIALTDGVVCYHLKSAIGRLRPFKVIPDAHRLVESSGYGSMPSSHAANWFAGLTVAFFFYRSSVGLLLPLALAVCFGRVYSGVHYPGDVLAGALIGAATGAGVVWGMNALWKTLGRKYFPRALAVVPSLVPPAEPEPVTPVIKTDARHS